jgi:ornithine carbamoyltransferase
LEGLSKDAYPTLYEFDSTIQSIEVKPMSETSDIIGNYYDDIMIRGTVSDVIDDVKKGTKEITLNSSMINMGTPQAFCVGLP